MKEVVRVKAGGKGLNKCFRDTVRKQHLIIEDTIQGEMAEFGYSLFIGGKNEKKETKEYIKPVGLTKRKDCSFIIHSE